MDQDSLRSNILEAVETAKVVGEAKRAVVAKTSRSLSAATMEPEPTPLSDQDKVRTAQCGAVDSPDPPQANRQVVPERPPAIERPERLDQRRGQHLPARTSLRSHIWIELMMRLACSLRRPPRLCWYRPCSRP